jgi:hypothetical protein
MEDKTLIILPINTIKIGEDLYNYLIGAKNISEIVATLHKGQLITLTKSNIDDIFIRENNIILLYNCWKTITIEEATKFVYAALWKSHTISTKLLSLLLPRLPCANDGLLYAILSRIDKCYELLISATKDKKFEYFGYSPDLPNVPKCDALGYCCYMRKPILYIILIAKYVKWSDSYANSCESLHTGMRKYEERIRIKYSEFV